MVVQSHSLHQSPQKHLPIGCRWKRKTAVAAPSVTEEMFMNKLW